jgi:hypothetical protein
LDAKLEPLFLQIMRIRDEGKVDSALGLGHEALVDGFLDKAGDLRVACIKWPLEVTDETCFGLDGGYSQGRGGGGQVVGGQREQCLAPSTFLKDQVGMVLLEPR